MARVLKPPTAIDLAPGEQSVFLAGSIEMGRAERWQGVFEQALAGSPLAILNPRRDMWDESWKQSISNPLFREQVEWELAGLEMATVVAMYFAPDTKSPITLLELGLVARTGRLVVCCSPEFWRRGNVEVVCPLRRAAGQRTWGVGVPRSGTFHPRLVESAQGTRP